MKNQRAIETEKEELKKKYENYKNQFIKERTEKDKLIKELAIIKQEKAETLPEVKELKIKYDQLKTMF